MKYEYYFDNLKKLYAETQDQRMEIGKIKEFLLEAVDYAQQHKLDEASVLESWQIMDAISKDLKSWGHNDSHKYWDGTMLAAVKELKDEIGKGTKEYQFTSRLCAFLMDDLDST
jgi:hypothetical protein